jgi:hypothetical protein
MKKATSEESKRMSRQVTEKLKQTNPNQMSKEALSMVASVLISWGS